MSNKTFRETLLASTVIAGMSFVATPAFAQADQPQPAPTGQPAAQPAEEAPAIVVTGTLIRNPNLLASAPVSVVGQDELQLRQTNTAEEVLRDLPGAVPSIGNAVNNGNGGSAYRRPSRPRQFPQPRPARRPAHRAFERGRPRRPQRHSAGAGRARRHADRRRGGDLRRRRGVGRGQLHHPPRFRGRRAGGERADHRAGRRQRLPRRRHDRRQFRRRPRQCRAVARLSACRPRLPGRARFLAATPTPRRPAIPAARAPQFPAASRATASPRGPVAKSTRPAARSSAPFVAFNFNPYNIFQTPFERFNIYGAGHYDVADNIEFYMRGMFSKNTVNTIIAPSGIFGATLLVPVSNPFLPAAARAQFCASQDFDPVTPGVQTLTPAQCAAAAAATSPADPNFRTFLVATGRRMPEAGPRLSSFVTNMFDYRAGLRIGITQSINLDISGSYGQSENRQTQTGYIETSHVRTALYTTSATSCNLGPAPAVISPVNGLPFTVAPGGAGTAGCVPLNIFRRPGHDHAADALLPHGRRHQRAVDFPRASPGAAEWRFRRVLALGGGSDRLRGRRRISPLSRRPARGFPVGDVGRARRRRRRDPELQWRLQGLRGLWRVDRAVGPAPAGLRESDARSGHPLFRLYGRGADLAELQHDHLEAGGHLGADARHPLPRQLPARGPRPEHQRIVRADRRRPDRACDRPLPRRVAGRTMRICARSASRRALR